VVGRDAHVTFAGSISLPIQIQQRGIAVHKKAMTLAAMLFLALAASSFADETPADGTPANGTPANDAAPVATLADGTLAVEEATNQFYASLSALLAGDASSMDQIWSHADDVTCMGPIGGILTGWEQLSATFADQAAKKLGGHAEAVDLHFTVGNDWALVEGYEVGVARNAAGESEQYRIRATNSFRKENGQWKMIGHHTDPFDFLDSDWDKAANERNNDSSTAQPVTDSNEQADADDDSIDVKQGEVILKLDE
jgi:ketosteroid isomerase-like protein